MKNITQAFLLSTLVSIPSLGHSEDISPPEYPIREATEAEITEFCDPDTNPDLQNQVVSFRQGNEFPFEVINCEHGFVTERTCDTLLELINFKFNMLSIARQYGNDFGDSSEPPLNRFNELIGPYNEHCQHLLY